jgi:hypothetical protein
MGSSALYHHSGMAVFHSCCSVAHALFYLGILCRVSQLRNFGTESNYVWDHILGKIWWSLSRQTNIFFLFKDDDDMRSSYANSADSCGKFQKFF